jgi:hypothetical protein
VSARRRIVLGIGDAGKPFDPQREGLDERRCSSDYRHRLREIADADSSLRMQTRRQKVRLRMVFGRRPSIPTSAPRERALTLPRGPVREALVVSFAILVYFGVRNLTAGSADTAFANARHLISLEDALGIGWEDAVQSVTLRSELLIDAANWIYIWGHWPVILGAAVGLYLYRRRHYYLLRDGMIASGLIGFFLFALFPVAPPRLLDVGLVDTVTQRSDAYRALQPPGLTNQYAAFPSLHAGWNLLVGIVLVTAVASLAVRLAAVALPIAMSLAVVATANHFVVDVAGGVVVVLAGLAIAIFLQNRRDASTLPRDEVSGDRGGLPGDRAAVRRGASGGKPARPAARGRAPRRGPGRGRRAPVPRAAGDPPPEDRRAAPALLGPMVDRLAVPAPARARGAAGRDPTGDRADARPQRAGHAPRGDRPD